MLTAILISAVLLILFPFIVLLCLGLLARTSNLPFELLQEVDMPEEHKQKAKKCFKDVRKKSMKDILYDCTAPYVMFFVLPFIKRDADKLPSIFSAWDNEISINGDGWAVLRDNKWTRVIKDERYGETPVSYSDVNYTGDAYYAEGHHPRSFWARYVWLGWRNRASKLAYDMGFEVTRELIHDTEYWGNLNISPENPGVLVRRMGNYYEIFAYKDAGVFTRRTRYGYKIGNGLQYGAPRVMIVTIGVSFKRKK